MTHVLVTGGAGYIGSHACKSLARAGYVPVTYDSLVSGHERAVRWGPFEPGDLLDRARLDTVLGRYRPAACLHFAAFGSVGESIRNPRKYYSNNVGGTLNLIEALDDHGVGRLVFSSTCATYGIPESLPITEATPQQPVNPYGRSKRMVEEMLADFGDAHALDWVALRYFNAAGADPEGEIGEDHSPETHLIPLVLGAASGRNDAVTVFGTDYQTPDGTCIRDYIHVSDLADAHVLALRALEDGAPSGAINLGNGIGYSVAQVIEIARQVTGCDIPVVFGERRAGDPAALIADASRARSMLGWKPRFDALDDIIATAWAWHQRHVMRPADTTIST